MSTILDRALRAQAISMREFGYPDVSVDLVRRYHAGWLRGEKSQGVVAMFCERAFEEHPNLFGTKEPT